LEAATEPSSSLEQDLASRLGEDVPATRSWPQPETPPGLRYIVGSATTGIEGARCLFAGGREQMPDSDPRERRQSSRE
jgi:hypothetical protein